MHENNCNYFSVGSPKILDFTSGHMPVIATINARMIYMNLIFHINLHFSVEKLAGKCLNQHVNKKLKLKTVEELETTT